MTQGILGQSPSECFQQFRAHVQDLVGQTLGARTPIIAWEYKERSSGLHKAHLSFREGGPVSVPLKTKKHGGVHFYLWQDLGTETLLVDGRQRFRLNTIRYNYRLQQAPETQAHALIRWEYDRTLRPDKRRACRHHVQMAGSLGGNDEFDLNKLHTPTGWVLLEEVIRFLIHDLGVKPPCGNEWPKILWESEQEFYRSFTSKDF